MKCLNIFHYSTNSTGQNYLSESQIGVQKGYCLVYHFPVLTGQLYHQGDSLSWLEDIWCGSFKGISLKLSMRISQLGSLIRLLSLLPPDIFEFGSSKYPRSLNVSLHQIISDFAGRRQSLKSKGSQLITNQWVCIQINTKYGYFRELSSLAKFKAREKTTPRQFVKIKCAKR